MVIEAKSLSLPDHTQLPESDGTFVKNFQEHPQSILLTDLILSRLQEIHPDGHGIMIQIFSGHGKTASNYFRLYFYLVANLEV